MPLDTVARHFQPASQWMSRHSRALSAGFVLALCGFAAAAFGVAPLLPDPAALPQRLVVDALAPQGMRSQLEALAEQDLQLWRSDLTRSADSAESLLQRLGVSDTEAVAFMRSDATAKRVFDGRAGKMVQARVAADGRLIELVARFAAADGAQRQPQFTRLTVSRDDRNLSSRVEIAELVGRTRLASGTIRSSLFAATDEARIPDAVAVQLAEIFAADIDFHRELRKGDTFSVVYEALTADDEPVTWMSSTGRVLSAEFVNDGKSHQAVWFADGSGRGAYFDFNGQSKRRAFLASPMEFSRVTSGFAMRFHPILQRMRAHRGVDYAAPRGTPVRAVGDARVEFAGWQNGYGNVVKLEHDNDRSTVYAHLSRVDVRKGQRVEQGQRVGTVGSTGLATGPHLHFEFLIKDRHVDPLRVARASETITIDAGSRAQFAELSRSAQVQLGVAETLVGTRVQAE